MPHTDETAILLQRAAAGDAVAWGALLTEHQARLCRMVTFRMDPRLRGRVDAADILQDSYLEATDHRVAYFAKPDVPLFLWLRGVVANKLLEVHRHHLATKMREVDREAAPCAGANPDATSGALIHQLAGDSTGPRTAAARSEVKLRLQGALQSMDPMDREVLALRHFEQLSNSEAAAELHIEERAAAKRYLRALQRLKTILTGMPGGLTEFR
jgi:RNA polymerase sigma-70 factor (ECF subfamily)